MARIKRENLCSAYSGDAPYVHVICAREDFRRAYNTIRNLSQAGFNIWYDEELALTGNENVEETFESLGNKNCRAVLLFFSEACEFSLLIQNEISRAIGAEKFFCCALFDSDTDLPPLFDRYSNKQVTTNFENISELLPTECRASEGESMEEPSEFLTEDDLDGVRIKRYFGTGNFVDIPTMLNGRTVVSIDNFAFAAKTPITVNVPSCVRNIALSAFSFNNHNVTLYCSENSAAHHFAQSEKINFKLTDFASDADKDDLKRLLETKPKIDLPESLPLQNEYTDPYIYISFSARDSDNVRPIIERLSGMGYRLYVADRTSAQTAREKIENSAIFMIFVSEDTYYDDFVVNEELPCLSNYSGLYYSVCIDDKLTLPEGFRTQRVRKKSINRTDYADAERFFVALCEPLAQCRGEEQLFNPDFKFNTTNIGVVLAKYNGYSTRPEIDSTYSNQPLIEIGEFAFAGCDFVEQVIIPEGVTAIGGFAFSGCKALKTVVLPNSLRQLGSFVFSGCSSLESIVLPDGIVSTGTNLFEGCVSLEDISMPADLEELGWYTFKNCTSLQEVQVPENVTAIGEFAFSGCTKLDTVEIPASVLEIGQSAFKGCKNVSIVGYKRTRASKFASRNNIPFIEDRRKRKHGGSAAGWIVAIIAALAAVGIALHAFDIVDFTKLF